MTAHIITQPEWKDGKAVLNVLDALLAATGSPTTRHVYGSWARQVKRINPDIGNYHMYEGEPVLDRPAEIDDADKLYLLCAVSFDWRHNSVATYKAVVLKGGQWIDTGVAVVDAHDRQWAYTIQSQMRSLLQAVTPPTPLYARAAAVLAESERLLADNGIEIRSYPRAIFVITDGSINAPEDH